MCGAVRDQIIFWVAYVGGHIDMVLLYFMVKIIVKGWRRLAKGGRNVSSK